MKKLNLIPVDIGAGNGKVFLAAFNGSTLSFEEIHRFYNRPVMLLGTLYWDLLRIMDEIFTGFTKAFQKSEGNITCCSIDTWGADFGLIDKYGNMISNPLCYRDRAIKDIEKHAYKIISPDKLNELNCSKTYPYCTLFQLYYVYRFRINNAELVEKYLPISNLINYFLTGVKSIEPSMLSGSQFFNIETKKLRPDILDIFKIQSSIIPDISEPGTIIGNVGEDIIESSGLNHGSKVALVCGHDTASAVTGIPLGHDSSISCYVICGTWSVVGIETEKPVLKESVKVSDFTNWCGYREKNLFVKIFSGFYFIQECKKTWELEDGKTSGYEDLYLDIEKPSGSAAVVDFGCDLLFNDEKSMPERFIDYFNFTSQVFEFSRKSIIISILQSIALETKLTIRELEMHSGIKIEKVHMAGGGSRVKIFCQWVADCTDRFVLTGHPEATINGNIIAQLIALGELDDIRQGRELICDSFGETIYYPDRSASIDWDKLTEKYVGLKSLQ